MDEAKDLIRTIEPPLVQDGSTETGGSEVDLPDPRRELLLEITRRLADPTSTIRFAHGKSRMPSAWTIIDSPDGKVHFSIRSRDERPSPTGQFRYISLDFLNESTGEDGGLGYSDEVSDIPNRPPANYWTTINEDSASPEFIELWKNRGGHYRANSKRVRNASRDDILMFTQLMKDGHPNMEMLETAFGNTGFKRLPARKVPTPTPLLQGASTLYRRLRG